MAKQQLPMMPKQGGGFGRLLGAAILLGFLLLVIQSPAEAAQILKGIGAVLGSGLDAITTFIGELS
ncbi:hypothetical protein [Saccharopolyspora sp. 6V]|uniref:hypothetical protein n=1 Tax=Saccharopolyspora sp. 6V TaxID=2877239 RepID=UPI001CD7E0CB|nr:hypothetical protein [Saccharopolyspora sp. 6V]MCA1194181.1 hypothetical protein [Saccharopolyspora sp. 6V]